MSEQEKAFAGLIHENRQTRQQHRARKRGIEATACAIRERALLDAHKALTGKSWQDIANG